MSSLQQVSDGGSVEYVLVEEEPTLRRNSVGVADTQLGELATDLLVIAPSICAILHAPNAFV
jgi:hypothetical protein